MRDGDSSDRRTFLLRLARTATYSAPVIHTLAAPRSAGGQGFAGKGKMRGTSMGKSPLRGTTPFAPRLPRPAWDPGVDGGPGLGDRQKPPSEQKPPSQ
jgi:hypothetical protein